MAKAIYRLTEPITLKYNIGLVGDIDPEELLRIVPNGYR